jgi:hypothetical protein|uniref:Uncharacterized protein n=1 Tax=Attheya septentrionalis TaxID=420275 RepID=A0A7S2XTW0_9STRA|mmetsp:Transcript_869/g.1626  ORF Transcript_869/g.1626 Transcript_869/m.1626 type:complete len:337 (+) Transcript_869:174-1184(+)
MSSATIAPTTTGDHSKLVFRDRLGAILGGMYNDSMRRAIRTVLLYEAHRCIADRIVHEKLRVFQRKICLFDTACEILKTLTFIPKNYRDEIMFRTASSKLPLSPDLAWRRMKAIDPAIKKYILPGIRPLLAAGKSHTQVCEEFIQKQYEMISKNPGPKRPFIWEYSHLQIFLVYRMFYKGDKVDPNLPISIAPKKVPVPSKKPPAGAMRMAADDSDGEFHDANDGEANIVAQILHNTATGSVDRGIGAVIESSEVDERRRLLSEVKDHMSLLKEFEGVVPQDELVRRKKELFLAMPSAPPAAGPPQEALAVPFSPQNPKRKALPKSGDKMKKVQKV